MSALDNAASEHEFNPNCEHGVAVELDEYCEACRMEWVEWAMDREREPARAGRSSC